MNYFKRELTKLIIVYWNFIFKDGKDWLDKVRPFFEIEAKKFLFQKGLIKNNENIKNLAKKWKKYSESMFNPSSPQDFYLNWQGEVGAANISANIIDQLSRQYIASNLIRQFGVTHQFKGNILDYGCGTAALSLSWQREFAKHCQLLLADVENLPREFVRYYIKRYSQYKTRIVDVDLKNIKDNTLDVILCINVLEHLPNPSEVFKRLDSKLKNEGILIVETPWGGHPEHLKEALVDWEENGGGKILKEKYRKLRKMNQFISLSGIYKKK